MRDWPAGLQRVVYQSRHRDAVEHKPRLIIGGLRDYVWAMRRFSLSRRRDNPSFDRYAWGRPANDFAATAGQPHCSTRSCAPGWRRRKRPATGRGWYVDSAAALDAAGSCGPLLRDRPRWWLGAGVAAGLGLEDDNTVVLLLITLAVGILFTAQRPVLRTSWPWAG
jgi:Dolichyl-phosphate-mannose-protein mannosyltransferase